MNMVTFALVIIGFVPFCHGMALSISNENVFQSSLHQITSQNNTCNVRFHQYSPMNPKIQKSYLTVILSGYVETDHSDYEYIANAVRPFSEAVFTNWNPSKKCDFGDFVRFLSEMSFYTSDSETSFGIILVVHGLKASFAAQHFLGRYSDSNSQNKLKFVSLILLGQSLHFGIEDNSVSVLSLGGTLDGVFRVTAFAVDFDREQFRRKLLVNNQSTFGIRDYILLEGLNHGSFSNRFDAPARLHDLDAAVSNNVAQIWISEVIYCYLKKSLFGLNIDELMAVGSYSELLHATEHFVSPFLLSLFQESNHALLPPCSYFSDSDPRSVDPSLCFVGSSWSEKFQLYLGGLVPSLRESMIEFIDMDRMELSNWQRTRIANQRNGTIVKGSNGIEFIAFDETHAAWVHFPLHLPVVFGSYECKHHERSCRVNVSLTSEKVFEPSTYNRLSKKTRDHLYGYDIANPPSHTFVPVISSTEIKGKMASQESIQTSSGLNVTFNGTDGSEKYGQYLCSRGNQLALDYALAILERYSRTQWKSPAAPSIKSVPRRLRMKIVMERDSGPQNIGPLWIWNPPARKIKGDALHISVVSLVTPLRYPVKMAAGFHFCKAISPAWFMEWIAIDSLRYRPSLNVQI